MYVMNICIKHARKRSQFSFMLRSVVSLQLMVAQLLGALTFEWIFTQTNQMSKYSAPIVCYLHPIIQGTIKWMLETSIEKFDMGDVYEFSALAIAAFPYRFLFFQIDQLIAIGVLMFVKFSYKFYTHYLTMVCHWKREALKE